MITPAQGGKPRVATVMQRQDGDWCWSERELGRGGAEGEGWGGRGQRGLSGSEGVQRGRRVRRPGSRAAEAEAPREGTGAGLRRGGPRHPHKSQQNLT